MCLELKKKLDSKLETLYITGKYNVDSNRAENLACIHFNLHICEKLEFLPRQLLPRRPQLLQSHTKKKKKKITFIIGEIKITYRGKLNSSFY